MSRTVISVENLGKKYVIGHQRAQNAGETFREMLLRNARGLVRSAAQLAKGQQIAAGDEIEEFWALDDVSFEVKRGEVLGVIGANGAGKSTLLKILSRITEPTRGRAVIEGQVASLLEVGTGFHAELTGRENIFLNGAILGMTRREVHAKLDEIVAFAEVETFIDTPVKRFSSGMYVRLAFSVAAHLEPEILIIDEVLAVGDVDFQKRCLGKIKEVATGGRTVLFVSHNLAAVDNLCSRAIVLAHGRLVGGGRPSEAIATYTKSRLAANGGTHSSSRRPGWAQACIQQVEILDGNQTRRETFGLGESIIVKMIFKGVRLRRPGMGVVINHDLRGAVGGVNTRMSGFAVEPADYMAGVFECRLPRPQMLQGKYSIDVWLSDGDTNIDMVPAAATFDVIEADIYGTGRTPFAHLGVIFLEPSWRFADDGEHEAD